MTQVIKSLTQWQALRADTALSHVSIGLVATMGGLHEGHAHLMRQSVKENDVTVLTLFVNPMQFNDKNDYEHYPRTEQSDIALARKLGVDYVFMPESAELYLDDYQYQIHENNISQDFEGLARPGHFAGVLTVVLKLLQLIKPTRAYFGEKDYQQYALIKGLVQAFFIETEIICCPTVRNADGLPLSSRNSHLNPRALKHAAQFSKILRTKEDLAAVERQLLAHGFEVDYVGEKYMRRFGAVRYENIRLIDNIKWPVK